MLCYIGADPDSCQVQAQQLPGIQYQWRSIPGNQILLNVLQTSCKTLTHTPEAARQAKKCFYAFNDQFRLSSLFQTETPDDLDSFVVGLIIDTRNWVSEKTYTLWKFSIIIPKIFTSCEKSLISPFTLRLILIQAQHKKHILVPSEFEQWHKTKNSQDISLH